MYGQPSSRDTRSSRFVDGYAALSLRTSLFSTVQVLRISTRDRVLVLAMMEDSAATAIFKSNFGAFA